MVEKILIAILSVLVIILATVILRRRRRVTHSVEIDEEIIRDLTASLFENISSGRIQDIAGSVSHIMIKHLNCDKIVFLKRKYNTFDVNYFYGIRGFEKRDFVIDIPPVRQKRLRVYHKVNDIDRLKSVISDDYIRFVRGFGFKYFFPVFLRDNLYGIYLINTPLSENNSLLNLITTTLAFNLSSAYHLGLQDYRVRKYKSLAESLRGNNPEQAADPGKETSSRGVFKTGRRNEFTRLLKMRNCRQLVPELVRHLRQGGMFSKVRLVTRDDADNSEFISAGWNTERNIEKMLKEYFDIILNNVQPNKILRLNEFSSNDDSLKPTIHQLEENDIDHIVAINWGNRKKALMVFNSHEEESTIKSRLRSFTSFAVPLVENVYRFEKAEALSYTDGLTGMYNIRYFRKRLDEELHRADRYKRTFSLMIIDLDDLKNVNDRHGHLAGDALIKSFGTIISRSVRSDDIISRYGGDEFCVIMPDTNRVESQIFMDRFVNDISPGAMKMDWAGQKLTYTVSIGGAIYPDDADSAEQLVHVADMALLQAKQAGGNTAVLHQANPGYIK